MRRVCARLRALGFSLATRSGLEFFAREGDWQTTSYVREVARLDAWEIDQRFESALRMNLPEAHVRVGDSYLLAQLDEFANKFDFIVYDNPQGLFGDGMRYCEHFEALALTSRLMTTGQTIVIFNVNRLPFDYDPQSAWARRRNEFYGRADTSVLDEAFLTGFYSDYFQTMGLTVEHVFIEPRHDRYLVYFVAVLRKR
jgi:hypothetical protein